LLLMPVRLLSTRSSRGHHAGKKARQEHEQTQAARAGDRPAGDVPRCYAPAAPLRHPVSDAGSSPTQHEGLRKALRLLKEGPFVNSPLTGSSASAVNDSTRVPILRAPRFHMPSSVTRVCNLPVHDRVWVFLFRVHVIFKN